ncbi:YihY/virulence factor BrkB family protein [Geodermatophilus obscurus]|uniref:YihY/virulence factor BrkB family protein n=1 Tax=Geodermatophilus obscurus TaxID=1861 RepID=UPI001FCC900B|nr:YihY/virulence factor BrkB family protein [Geodermatophilus obscurus]
MSTVRAGGPSRTGGAAGDGVVPLPPATATPPAPAPATDRATAPATAPAGIPPTAPDSGATRAEVAQPGRLDHWPPVVRVPLQVLGRTVSKAWKDRILGLSGEAAFWQILSVPPLLIALLGSLGFLGSWIGTDSVQTIEDTLVDASSEVLTADVVDSLVRPTLSDILGSGRLDVVSLGFLITLWAGSSATATFMNTIVIAYDQRDVRGPIATRFMALWLFVVGLLLAVLMLPLLVLGRGVLVALMPQDWQATATTLVNAVYWPLVVVGLVLALTSFYHVVLPRRLPWHRHLPGTLLAVGFFMVAATVLRLYVSDILVAALPYGALATPIAALLFLFFFGMAVLLGAELNAAVQERWPAPLRRHTRRAQRRRAAELDAEARRLGLR